MTATKMKVWYIMTSEDMTTDAAPLFPTHNHRRIEVRPHQGGPTRVEPANGWVALPGDDLEDTSTIMAFEQGSAQSFFHRMGLGLRVAYGTGAQRGRFPNGLRDPESISKAMLTMTKGFGIRLEDVEPAVAHWVRWLKPDAGKTAIRQADLVIARRMLALLREGRHAGAVAVLFVPGEVENPNVQTYG